MDIWSHSPGSSALVGIALAFEVINHIIHTCLQQVHTDIAWHLRGWETQQGELSAEVTQPATA